MNALTVEQFKAALPDKVRKSVNQEIVDNINKVLVNPEDYENYRNNLISWSSVIADGKFSVEQYVDAVRYVGFKTMGASNIDAYMKTFPDRYAAHLAKGTSAKDIASYVSAYNKNKLVNLILEQTLIPVHILNMDMYQRALNVQADLMMNAKSEKVRCDAANSIMSQLKPPEIKKVELDITHKESSAIAELKQASLELARQQRAALEAGQMTAKDVAHSRIGNVVDVEAKVV